MRRILFAFWSSYKIDRDQQWQSSMIKTGLTGTLRTIVVVNVRYVNIGDVFAIDIVDGGPRA